MRIRLIRLLALWLAVIVMTGGCTLLEEEGDYEWSMADDDQTLCDLLNDDSTFVTMPSKVIGDLELSWVNAADTTIAKLYDSLATDVNTRITYPTANDTSYLYLDIAMMDVPLLVALNDYVDVALVQRDGGVVEPSSAHVPLEIIAGCNILKSRYEFTLTDTEYLMRFILTEATQAGETDPTTSQRLYLHVVAMPSL
jgi:hypothetical protein